MIYFAQPVTGGPVKIGTSTDVESRMSQLEAHYGQPLALLAVVEGSRAEERAWHERFSHLRLGRTEQFRPAPELMAAIGRPLLVGANPETVEASDPPKIKVFGIRARVEWAAWVEEMAEHERTTVAGLIDRALKEFGEKINYPKLPPRRVP